MDHAYWHDQGWLDARRTFYLDHRSGRAKVALARLTGALIARFVTS